MFILRIYILNVGRELKYYLNLEFSIEKFKIEHHRTNLVLFSFEKGIIKVEIQEKKQRVI